MVTAILHDMVDMVLDIIHCFHCRAPRYLLKQRAKVNPDQNFLYHHQKAMINLPETYPNPPTISLLPLRPKTCMPKLGPVASPQGPQISALFDAPLVSIIWYICLTFCPKMLAKRLVQRN